MVKHRSSDHGYNKQNDRDIYVWFQMTTSS